MVSNWRPTTWGEEISLEYGKGLRDYQHAEGRTPVFGTNGQVGWTNEEPLADGPGIILGRKGAYRGIRFSHTPFYVIDTAYYVKTKSALDMRWLYYAMIHHRLGSIDDGSPIPSTTRAAVYVRELCIATDHEQRAIAKILGDLDDKIELLRRMNATLEETARALFGAWFVDFLPVRAKASGATTFRGVPQEQFDSLPDAFELSEIGELPSGWSADELRGQFKLTMGQSPPGSTYNDEELGVPFFQGSTDFGFRFPENRKFCSKPSRFAEEGDTLVSVRAPVGDVNMAWEDCCIGRGVAALRHNSGARSYTYYATSNLKSKFDVFEGAGTVFGSINKGQFESIKVVVPPNPVIKAFEAISGPLDDRIRVNTAEIRSLEALRDTLLPKLMSGELEAPSLDALGASEAI